MNCVRTVNKRIARDIRQSIATGSWREGYGELVVAFLSLLYIVGWTFGTAYLMDLAGITPNEHMFLGGVIITVSAVVMVLLYFYLIAIHDECSKKGASE